MKEFKTLHRLRLRFLWPKMRGDISSWVRMWPHCVLMDKQTHENKELVFSWPITSRFFILHVDLWAPGSLTDYRGNTYLLAGMCDLTGFVVQSAVTNITSHDLARVFYEEFLLKFDMCGMVIVDAGSNFLAIFEAMCDVLTIAGSTRPQRAITKQSASNDTSVFSTKLSPLPLMIATTQLFGSLLPILPVCMEQQPHPWYQHSPQRRSRRLPVPIPH
jgi:hypothetical protein